MNLSYLDRFLPSKNEIQRKIETSKLKDSHLGSSSDIFLTLNKSARNSKYINYDLLGKYLSSQEIQKILAMIKVGIEQEEIYIKHGKLLLYSIGGHFALHQDTKINNKHLGTILIFPPKNYFHFTGGELICSNQIVLTHLPESWHLIYIPLKTEHSITEILKGHRIVFKYSLFTKGRININAKNYLLPINYEAKFINQSNKKDEKLEDGYPYDNEKLEDGYPYDNEKLEDGYPYDNEKLEDGYPYDNEKLEDGYPYDDWSDSNSEDNQRCNLFD